MNEIIKVNNDTMTVSARDLYESLEVNTPFHKWFPRMCEYGFAENEDFWTKMSESTGGRPAAEYDISVDMAKQICMIQRTEKGKQMRQYFIDLEKAWNTPEQVMARALKLADKTIENLQTKIIGLANENTRLTERNAVLMHTKKTYTATEIAKELGMKSAKELNKQLSDMGIQFKQNDTWVMYSKYSDLGYVSIKQEVLDSGKVIYNRRFTQDGRDFVLNLFKRGA